jgi:hypothetical protein
MPRGGIFEKNCVVTSLVLHCPFNAAGTPSECGQALNFADLHLAFRLRPLVQVAMMRWQAVRIRLMELETAHGRVTDEAFEFVAFAGSANDSSTSWRRCNRLNPATARQRAGCWYLHSFSDY